MSRIIRVIPRLDIKGPNLVKGIHLEGLRVLGKPEEFAEHYYHAGADELLYQDVVASLYGRNSLDDFIAKTAKTIFIPLTVGGGIRTIDDIRRILRVGADKVTLNTAAINNPKFVADAANMFGSSTISISIEAGKQADGTYLAYTDNGREYTGKEVVSWAKEVEKLGAGEIIVTSIDQEGTGEGYDSKLTALVADAVHIPVVALGGAGKLEDILTVIHDGHASAVSFASLLHYELINKRRATFEEDRQEGNIEFLKKGSQFSKIKPMTIPKVKKYLTDHGISCRYPV